MKAQCHIIRTSVWIYHSPESIRDLWTSERVGSVLCASSLYMRDVRPSSVISIEDHNIIMVGII